MKYCKFCGNQVEAKQKCGCENAVAHRALMQKVIIIGSAMLAALVIIFGIVFLVNGVSDRSDDSEMINPFDYISNVRCEGLNTQGTFRYDFDRQGLMKALMDGRFQTDEEATQYLSLYMAYEEAWDYSITKTYDLSNGDVVTITFTVEDLLKDRLQSGSKQYTVSGLTEPKRIDAFENIELAVDGVSGEAQANIKILFEKEDSLGLYDFKIEPSSNLSTGDKVTVTILPQVLSKLAEVKGIIPIETSKEFVVEELTAYVSSVDQLPIELLQGFSEQFLIDSEQAQKEGWGFTYENFQYLETYFLTLEDNCNRGDFYFIDDELYCIPAQNILQIVVSYEEYLDGEFRKTVYCCLEFYDLIVALDGSVTIIYKNGQMQNYYKNPLVEYEPVYEVTSIK